MLHGYDRKVEGVMFQENRRLVRVGERCLKFRPRAFGDESNGITRYREQELAVKQHGWQRGNDLSSLTGMRGLFYFLSN